MVNEHWKVIANVKSEVHFLLFALLKFVAILLCVVNRSSFHMRSTIPSAAGLVSLVHWRFPGGSSCEVLKDKEKKFV